MNSSKKAKTKAAKSGGAAAVLLKDLKDECRAKGFYGVSKMSKDECIQKLGEAALAEMEAAASAASSNRVSAAVAKLAESQRTIARVNLDATDADAVLLTTPSTPQRGGPVGSKRKSTGNRSGSGAAAAKKSQANRSYAAVAARTAAGNADWIETEGGEESTLTPTTNTKKRATPDTSGQTRRATAKRRKAFAGVMVSAKQAAALRERSNTLIRAKAQIALDKAAAERAAKKAKNNGVHQRSQPLAARTPAKSKAATAETKKTARKEAAEKAMLQAQSLAAFVATAATPNARKTTGTGVSTVQGPDTYPRISSSLTKKQLLLELEERGITHLDRTHRVVQLVDCLGAGTIHLTDTPQYKAYEKVRAQMKNEIEKESDVSEEDAKIYREQRTLEATTVCMPALHSCLLARSKDVFCELPVGKKKSGPMVFSRSNERCTVKGPTCKIVGSYLSCPTCTIAFDACQECVQYANLSPAEKQRVVRRKAENARAAGFNAKVRNPTAPSRDKSHLLAYVVWFSESKEEADAEDAPEKIFESSFDTKEEANARAKYKFFVENPWGMGVVELRVGNADSIEESMSSDDGLGRWEANPADRTRWTVAVLPKDAWGV